MPIADTSAWVEFLRDRPTSVADRLAGLIRDGRVDMPEPVAMELLAGARDHPELAAVKKVIAGVPSLPTGGFRSWEDAAAVYRRCRAAGVTPRSHVDCLIAAVAIREGVPVLHADRDFDKIAEHTPLRIVATD